MKLTKPIKKWYKTPKDILDAIKKAEEGVSILQAIAKKEGVERKFTLDGRLVGDIGELVVARHFEISPNEKPKGFAHDLFAISKKGKLGVQVKVRREATINSLEFKYRPEVLILLIFKSDWTEWGIFYHGSGKIIHEEGTIVDKDLHFKRNNQNRIVKVSLQRLLHHNSDKFIKLRMVDKS